MKCPVDDVVLMMSERSGIEIDYCPTCRGVWLDRGELDKILDRAAQESPAGPAAKSGPGAVAGAGPAAGAAAGYAADPGPVPDPRAAHGSGPFDQGPVPPPPHDDYPPRRRFMGSAPSAPSPEDHYNGGYRGGYPQRRRKKSWLNELFD